MSEATPLASPQKTGFSLSPYISIIRPFTLFPPFLGTVSGALIAIGSHSARGEMGYIKNLEKSWGLILLGGIIAAALNAASNTLNQFWEIEVDRINKPKRVLPSGQMPPYAALGYAIFLYIFGLALAWPIQPAPKVHHTFWCALIAAIATVLYSSKPIYLKSRGWLANATIAVVRGCLLVVAGWGCVASVLDVEPWLVGFIFMLFLLGAASTKDFADIEGDKTGGIRTLPIIYGPQKASRMIAPFCFVPWLLLPIGVFLPNPSTGAPILHAQKLPILILGLALAAYGLFIAQLMRKFDATSIEGNHPAWKHMYLMMLAAQIGLVICYTI